MAATDARPVPRKNTAYRVTFPILDADGDLVTGAATLDSEVSIDGGTFADCTNEATEIATSSGIYFLDLSAAEMNGDTIAVIVKTGTAGAKTTTLVFYPEELGDYRISTPANFTDLSISATTGLVNITQTAADKVWSTTTRAITDKAGFALSAAGIQAIWDALTSALTTVGSIGKLLADNVNATISSRASSTTLGTPAGASIAADIAAVKTDTAATLADTGTDGVVVAAASKTGYELSAAGVDAIWDEPTAGHATAGTTGKALTDAGSAGDPWSTALPGAYTAGQAGKIVGDNVNATISSRAATGDAMALTAAAVDAILDDAVAGSTTLRQMLRGFAAALLGKVSGAGTTSVTIRDIADTKNVIVATVDADGNRSAVTLDLS